MKTVITRAFALFALAGLMTATSFAQTVPAPDTAVAPSNFVAAGFAFDGAQSNGWGTYAKSIGAGVYSISTVDVTVQSLKPLTFQHSVRTGIGYDVTNLVPSLSFGGRLHLIGVSDGGVSATTAALGDAFSSGGFATYDLGVKLRHMQLVAGGRWLKTSTGGTQTIVEVGIGHTF